MKKTVMIIMFILLSVHVSALIAGNEEIVYDGECSELIVNISIDPGQDIGEYTLEPDCIVIKELTDNYKVFKCLCESNRTTLILSPAVNSKGDYTITIDQYKYVDNESEEPVEFNITNPSTKNVTQEITLPNNITIDRIIPPGESLVYVETEEEFIIIPESNVTFEKIETDDNNINLVCIASGTKCFDIYAKSSPYSVKINGTPISFGYDSITNLIHFCTTFSTKNVAITWTVPSQPSGAEETQGGGGGSSGAFTTRFEADKPRRLMMKLNIISRFWVNGEQYTIILKELFNDSVNIGIKDDVVRLYIEQPKIINIEEDASDLKLTLKEIRGRVAFIEFEKIDLKKPIVSINKTIENVTSEEPKPVDTTEEATGDVTVEFPEEEPDRSVIRIIWGKIRALFRYLASLFQKTGGR